MQKILENTNRNDAKSKLYNAVKAFKKVKIKNLIFVILLLIANTYAWFVYNSRVSGSITAHVSSWEIEFVATEDGALTELVMDVSRVYPGMDEYRKEITVTNKGDTNASLQYTIKYVKILDTEYIVDEEGNLTTEEIENKISNEYPFKINIIQDDSLLKDGSGNGSFVITVNWEFESGNDEIDTYWGNKAYEFYSIHPGESCIEIELMLEAKQYNN
jgi:hypothetical protein